MLYLQHNRKNLKEYTTAYELADEVEKMIPGAPEEWYKQVKDYLNKNAFSMCIRGAKMTFGNGYRLIQQD